LIYYAIGADKFATAEEGYVNRCLHGNRCLQGKLSGICPILNKYFKSVVFAEKTISHVEIVGMLVHTCIYAEFCPGMAGVHDDFFSIKF
jgi:hypothetical protein